LRSIFVLLMVIFAAVLFFCVNVSDGATFPFQIFSTNGSYYNNPGVNLWVEVTNGVGIVDFIFHNDSTVNCSIARIYFDDGSLLGIDEVFNCPGTDFSKIFPGPGNLPNGELLEPDFDANREFSIGAENPPPENGVNNIPAGEWVKIHFDLINGGTLEDVIGELLTGELRVGLHVISFPDGFSNSAILTPEPTTIALLGLGALLLLRRRRRV